MILASSQHSPMGYCLGRVDLYKSDRVRARLQPPENAVKMANETSSIGFTPQMSPALDQIMRKPEYELVSARSTRGNPGV